MARRVRFLRKHVARAAIWRRKSARVEAGLLNVTYDSTGDIICAPAKCQKSIFFLNLS